ncbi:hypothetical protein JCM19238_4062 [Vibrio ponticus]|nr:hypothetical protein JCM19238_4062 [Vibrio ponticus]
MIERIRGAYQGRNKSSAYKDLVWTVATSSDVTLDIVGQTQLTLKTIQANLIQLGSHKHRIVSAQVYIADMKDKALMDRVWCDWLGEDENHWPSVPV